MTDPRDLTEQERRLLEQLVDSGGFDAVLASRVTAELKYRPVGFADEYIQASAWLMLARARQSAALRVIQRSAKGLSPDVVSGLLILWAAQASEIAEQLVKAHTHQPPPDGSVTH